MIEGKKYSVIYADPPWEQKGGSKIGGYTVVGGKQIWKRVSSLSESLPYETMTMQDIVNLPVENIAADNCHLYLWATNKYLPDAFEVIEGWGFRYSTTIVWAKNSMGGGLGGTYRINTEFLLFATRGRLKAIGSIKGTWHNVKREYVNGYPSHSKKPEYFRQLIEKVSPGKKLELFARKETPGWDVFGNQVENSIELQIN